MVEDYSPTRQERLNARSIPNHLKVSGDGVFFTLQGEGQSIGKPAVFLRLQGCNLACGWCDTKYTWDKKLPEFWKEGSNWSIERTIREIRQYGNTRRLVVTGGEPLLQQKKIQSIVDGLKNWTIEIETNGTISPIPELTERCQFNVSPKLNNSGNSLQKRYKPDVLKRFNELGNTTFKFVVVSPDDLEEVERLVVDCELDNEKVIIMPEGTRQDEIKEHSINLVEEVKNKGWRMLPRFHIMLWGPQRRI